MKNDKPRYRPCQAIINNKLETLYISHEFSTEHEMNGGELVTTHLLFCGLPGEKISVNSLKKNKAPSIIIDSGSVIFI
jgi:hypothetical protein